MPFRSAPAAALCLALSTTIVVPATALPRQLSTANRGISLGGASVDGPQEPSRVGHTEKPLPETPPSPPLLFDEADALFGKRTEVKDSHDRYSSGSGIEGGGGSAVDNIRVSENVAGKGGTTPPASVRKKSLRDLLVAQPRLERIPQPPGEAPTGNEAGNGRPSVAAKYTKLTRFNALDQRLVADWRPTVRSGPGSWQGHAGPIVEIPLHLVGGETVTFETTQLSSGADPVLHLLSPNVPIVYAARIPDIDNDDPIEPPPAPIYEVAHDDNSGPGKAARLTVEIPTTGIYTLVLRARTSTSGGDCILRKNNSQLGPPWAFGGYVERLTGLRKLETLRTVPLAGGPVRYHVMYLTQSDGLTLFRRVFAGEDGTAHFIDGQRYRSGLTAIIGATDPARVGPIRLVRDDRGYGDTDGDGLGNGLEQAIGTCSDEYGTRMGFECNQAADPRDTDGDGLRDDLELYGKVGSAPYQWLPRWGADPRHKDIFIEVDFMQREPDEPDQKASPEFLRAFAKSFASDASLATPWFLHNAISLVNPDHLPGVALHFDAGRDPAPDAPASDRTLYGSWGGHEPVPPVCEAEDDCKGASPGSVWRDRMEEARHGLFHYALPYPSGGGQCGIYSIACGWPLSSAGVAAHEFAHTLGLAHSGPESKNVVDANCKPNYPSLISYAYLQRGHREFSNGQRPPLNNAELYERFAVADPSSDEGQTYLDDLESKFDFLVDRDSGHVDWNRDGAFQDGPVRAWANNNGAGCELTRYHRMPFENSRTQRTPSLARLGGTTWAFYVDAAGRLAYQRTTSVFDCGAPTGTGCAGTTWQSGVLPGSWNGGIAGADVHRISDTALLAVYRTASGALHEVEIAANGATQYLGTVPAVAAAVGDPSIAGIPGSRLVIDPGKVVALSTSSRSAGVTGRRTVLGNAPQVALPPFLWNLHGVRLAYGDASGQVHVLYRSPNGTWGSDTPVPGVTLADNASAALVEAIRDGQRVVFGAFPTSSNRVEVHEMNTANGTWSLYDLLYRSVEGRPAIAWEPLSGEGDISGRLHLAYIKASADDVNKKTVRYAISAVTPGFGGTPDIGLDIDGDYDNVWYTAYGIDFLFEPGVDSNVRSLVARARSKPEIDMLLEFRPIGDGVLDFVMEDENDWEVFRYGMCRSLVNSGPYELTCPERPW